MPIKIGLLGLLMLVCSLKTNAQEDVLFTNKQLKMNYMNPAYIPEIMKATLTIGGRYQWTGIDGAPRSIYANGKYFFMGAHSQISLSFLSDDIGYQYTRQPKIGYAFMLPIGDDSYLNLGIGGGLVNRGYDASKIDPANTKNMEDSYDLQKGTAPDAEVGAEVLLQNLEIGASVNHLLEGTENVKMSPLYSGYVNYYFDTSEWWRLSPSYYVYNYRDRWKHQIMVLFYYIFDYEWNPSDLFYVGASYRYAYEGSLQAGINLFPSLSLFYSYDYFFGGLSHGNYGTHELGLEIKIPQKFQGCFANYGKSKKYTRYTRMR
jgi:type IX secretion system PorP/SprF family membrane protein